MTLARMAANNSYAALFFTLFFAETVDRQLIAGSFICSGKQFFCVVLCPYNFYETGCSAAYYNKNYVYRQTVFYPVFFV